MTPDTFKLFMTTLLESYSDKDHTLVIRDPDSGEVLGTSPWAKMQRQCLEHVPDEIAMELAQYVTMNIKTYGRVVPQMKEILDAYAELVHGPDDAEEQWALVADGQGKELAEVIFYSLGGQFSLRQADSAERASMRRAFLDAYRAERDAEKTTSRLGHDPRRQIEDRPPPKVLALTGKIKTMEVK